MERLRLKRDGGRRKIPRISDLLLVARKSIAVAFGVKAKRLTFFIFVVSKKDESCVAPFPRSRGRVHGAFGTGFGFLNRCMTTCMCNCKDIYITAVDDVHGDSSMHLSIIFQRQFSVAGHMFAAIESMANDQE